MRVRFQSSPQRIRKLSEYVSLRTHLVRKKSHLYHYAFFSWMRQAVTGQRLLSTAIHDMNNLHDFRTKVSTRRDVMGTLPQFMGCYAICYSMQRCERSESALISVRLNLAEPGARVSNNLAPRQLCKLFVSGKLSSCC